MCDCIRAIAHTDKHIMLYGIRHLKQDSSVQVDCVLCRHSLEQEADVLCLLAKVEQNWLAFDSAMPQSESKQSALKGGSITVVVQEGLQVQIPMAGMHLLLPVVLSYPLKWTAFCSCSEDAYRPAGSSSLLCCMQCCTV